MLIYIVLFWILIKLSAPLWCFVLVGISGLLGAIKWGMDIVSKK